MTDTLDYRSTEDNGLSLELLVNGEPLGMLIGSDHRSIPYWLIEDGLPAWGEETIEPGVDKRIVCVCSCGEYGCGHTHCRMIRAGGEVVLQDFEFDIRSANARRKDFRFRDENFDATVARLCADARNHGQARSKATRDSDR